MSLTPTLTPKANIVAGASVNESQAFDDGVNASIWGMAVHRLVIQRISKLTTKNSRVS